MARSRGLVALVVLTGFLVSVSAIPLSGRQSGAPLFPLSRRARLSAAVSGPLTVETKGETLAVFQRLANRAGIQIVAHPSFNPSRGGLPTSFTLQDVDVFDALDALSRQTQAVWEVYDSRTVVVVPESLRASIELQPVESVDLNSLTTTMKLSDIAEAVRSRVPSLKMTPGLPENALTFRDTVENLAIAEQTIIAMAEPRLPKPPSVAGIRAMDFAGNGYVFQEAQLKRTVAETHAALRPKIAGVLDLRLRGGSREILTSIAERFGFQVIVHGRSAFSTAGVTLEVSGVDAITALDLVAFQSGAFWQVLDSSTI